MLNQSVVLLTALAYVGLLFVIALALDARARNGGARSISAPVVYTLSLAIYCTSWTFYGAVGSAARNGVEYLAIYLGPTLVFAAWWGILRKMALISRRHRITSIADFLSSRYGKSAPVSALATVIALAAGAPYIALQLSAVARSYNLLIGVDAAARPESIFADTGFWVAGSMAVFAILFGARNLNADARNHGLVGAIAFESVVKLAALVAVGAFAAALLISNDAELWRAAAADPIAARMTEVHPGRDWRWATTLFLSAAAIMCLPRQFQIMIVERPDERALRVASWLFPLYMLLMSLCVAPIAFAGLGAAALGGADNPDFFVLTLPLENGRGGLALLAFIGGLSAAASMVVVSSMTLSIMIFNHLLAPVLLSGRRMADRNRGELKGLILTLRRGAIALVVLLGFVYYRAAPSAEGLAEIGLIAFTGAAQFLPALIGGLFWRRGNAAGALAGLGVGFVLWAYTLLIPSLALTWAPMDPLLTQGPFGIAFLRPTALFGVQINDTLAHALFWTMLGNIGAYTALSLTTEPSAFEQFQATLFVDALRDGADGRAAALRRSADPEDLSALCSRVLGAARTHRLFHDYNRARGAQGASPPPDAAFIAHVERELAASVGAAAARAMIASISHGEEVGLDAIIALLDETEQAVRYSQELERKSTELEQIAAELRAANERLKHMDELKDDFLSRVSHELRTPMTAICSFAEILTTDPPPDPDQARRFTQIIEQESRRLTRLLDEILDFSKIQDGAPLEVRVIDASAAASHAAEAMGGYAAARGARLCSFGDEAFILADQDRLEQILLNLISNAIKFNTAPAPWVSVGVDHKAEGIEIRVEDNGPGVQETDRPRLFSKFGRGEAAQNAPGSGLGLAISQQIARAMGGDLRFEPAPGGGAAFVLTLPEAQDGA